MKNVSLSVMESLVVETLIKDLARMPQEFKAQICEDDEMYLFSLGPARDPANRNTALVNYFMIGGSIRDAVKQVADWHFGSLCEVSSFLDFACGYGRFTRFIIQELTPRQVWAADIYAGAVKFQREYLGVQGIDSTSRPEDYLTQSTESAYDCIVANSFFSHMPDRTFSVWLDQLYGSLTERGVLMFSVHDASLRPAHTQMPESGILFSPHSESGSLGADEYGTAYVTEAYVRGCVDRISRGQACVHRIARGICGYQDLYVVSRRPGKSAMADLPFDHQPRGHVDAVADSSQGRIYLEGWAYDGNLNGAVVEIQVFVNNALVRSVVPSFPRGDVAAHFNAPSATQSGWYCLLPEKPNGEDIVLIKVVNAAGQSMILVCSDLQSLIAKRIPRSDAVTRSRRAEEDLHRPVFASAHLRR